MVVELLHIALWAGSGIASAPNKCGEDHDISCPLPAQSTSKINFYG